ncbi:hypothetical protein B0H14DRAFT_2930022 [Mycena olivaceomarginata]|nr:hypothetical protein B0H14DRAFT_2930022 [Mycena olivaceomarginata]
MLHLAYWWCSITLHRPFFSRRTQATRHSESEIDHVKLCTRAAENILELVESWSSVYGLRLASVTMLQVIFSAGTIFLLRALQATASPRTAHTVLRTALAHAETCVRYLHEMGRTWASATRTGDILHTMLNDRLKPLIERRLGEQIPAPDAGPTLSEWPAGLGAAGQHVLPVQHPYDNPNLDPAVGWSQSGDLSLQMQNGKAIFGIESSSAELIGETFPPLDTNKFLLPNLGYFGAPEFWEQDLSDAARTLFPP